MSLCNDTRLKVTALHQNCVQATVLYGPKSGSQVVKFAPSDVNLPFTLERYQYPMRLAYSLLIRHRDRHSRRLVYFCQSLSLHKVSYKLHFQELERLVMYKAISCHIGADILEFRGHSYQLTYGIRIRNVSRIR